MKITQENIAPERPADAFFNSSDSFANFEYQLNATLSSLREARLYCIEGTPLANALQAAANILNDLEVES